MKSLTLWLWVLLLLMYLDDGAEVALQGAGGGFSWSEKTEISAVLRSHYFHRMQIVSSTPIFVENSIGSFYFMS